MAGNSNLHASRADKADEIFKSINSVGNELLFGSSAYSDDLIAWVYIEKE